MFRPATLLVAMSLIVTSPATAQFGNLGRKAKEKAAQALGGQQPANTQALKFDDVMVELTPPVLDRVILGLRARAKHQGSNGRSVAELRRQAQARYDEAADLNRDRDNDRFEFNNKLGNARNCMGEVLSGLRNDQYQAMQRRFMGMTGANLQGDQSANAKFMQEFQRTSMEVAEAAASGDSARIRKAEAAMNKMMGIDPTADSAKARSQCNVPVPPPWMARADAANEESNKLHNEARELEAAANADGAKTSGMTGEQFGMALERIIGFLEAGGSLKYSATEQQALSARKSALQGLVS